RLQLRLRGDAAPPELVAAPGRSTMESPLPKPAARPAIAALIDRLREASTDSSDSDRFEKETTEAFRQLGYRATWLGGAGKTDVLLEADLGRDHSYRVVIDCKTTGRGSVSHAI